MTIDDDGGYGSTGRDWSAPMSPEGVAALIRAFAEIVGPDGQRCMAASSPAWFDDVGFSAEDTAIVGANGVTVGDYWSTPSDRTRERDAEIVERALIGVEPSSRSTIEALLATMRAGDGVLRRDLVEAVVHPLESEEVVAFVHVPEAEREWMLCVAHTNGYTDVAYALGADGMLAFWPEAGLLETIKDGNVPEAPSELPSATFQVSAVQSP